MLSIPEDQYKFKTPQNNPRELVEQEQVDFSVPTQNTWHKDSAFPDFIHNATFEEDITNNIQFNTYTKENPTDMEGKPQIPIVYTDIAPGLGHLASPAYSDPPDLTFSDPMQTQPIQT